MRVFAEQRRSGARERGSEARLSFRRVGARTVIESAFAESPLRLLMPRNHGPGAWAYTSTLGGGLVDGDAIRLRVNVGSGAVAALLSQGENRVYRSPGGCRSELVAEVEAGGFFALLPDPTVCFAGAWYEQKTELRLAPDAAAVAVEVLAAGRSARGERWAFRRYGGELSVRSGERALVRERVLLDPEHGSLPERLGRFDALCTVLLVGDALSAERTALARRIQAAPLPARAARIEQANEIAGGALLVRIAAVSLEDALCAVREHLQFLPDLLGDDPWARRP
ncbi:MAG TPA: urease accessory protein UreD [Myxococcales bacterium]|nr:urease accessory protein UreD [Myxococcales bacterium]